MTYQAESFYRGTIRQTVANDTSVPFTLKVSKVPELTAGLLTISPNTANEEIIEYDGVNSTSLTITVVKRGIKPSAQALLVSGTDYNNTAYQKEHSQNDAIRGDVNHLHIIQDYGDLEITKLEKSGGLREDFPINTTVVVDRATGYEVIKSVSDVTVPTSGDIVRLQKGDGNYEDISYNNLKTDIASVASPSIQETNYESIIAQGDTVGQLFDGLYKVQTEVKTSTAYGGGNTYKDHCLISAGKYILIYEFSSSLYAVVASLSSADVVTYGTPILVGAASSPTARCALIDTDKVVIVYAASASIAARSVIASISGTTITLGTELVENQSGNVVIVNVFKVRSTAYAFTFGVGINPSGIRINTVSGTTITGGTSTTFTFGFTQNTVYGTYLSDNLISFSEQISTNNQANVRIYAVNPVGTNFLTTYTGTISGTGGGGAPHTFYHTKYSDTEVIITNSATTEKSIFTIPPSGTVLVKTTLTANSASNYPTISIGTSIYGINTGTSIIVYQRDAVIGTISGTPAQTTQGIVYNNGRIFMFSGATNIPTIVNLARIYTIGVAFNNTGLFTPSRISANKSGVIKGYIYYVQGDGSISNGIGLTNSLVTSQIFGKGVATDKIMITI